MAPCEVNDTTSPSIVDPTAKAATKLMKASGSFTAGGGVERFRFEGPASRATAPGSALASADSARALPPA